MTPWGRSSGPLPLKVGEALWILCEIPGLEGWEVARRHPPSGMWEGYSGIKHYTKFEKSQGNFPTPISAPEIPEINATAQGMYVEQS